MCVQRSRGKGSKKAQQLPELSSTDLLGSNSRDVTLTMFRALGKILYNKRLTPGSLPAEQPSADQAQALLALSTDKLDTSRRLDIQDRCVHIYSKQSDAESTLHESQPCMPAFASSPASSTAVSHPNAVLTGSIVTDTETWLAYVHLLVMSYCAGRMVLRRLAGSQALRHC